MRQSNRLTNKYGSACLVSHWRGQLRLATSLVVFSAVNGLVFLWMGPQLLQLTNEHPAFQRLANYIWVLITLLLIFPWLAIGLLRAAERHVRLYDRQLSLIFVQIILLATTVLVIGQSVTLLQKQTSNFQKHASLAVPSDVAYTLTIDTEQRSLKISGLLDFGLVSDVRKTLAEHPDIKTLKLDSSGGQIYEGRGLSLLITELGLDTLVQSHCNSACTTAFIGGHVRRLTKGAKLGFHRYGIEGAELKKQVIYQNTALEEQRDRSIFQAKGVEEVFLDKAFTTPHNQLWYPEPDELVQAGVVTSLE